jgi:hypothetical protein
MVIFCRSGGNRLDSCGTPVSAQLADRTMLGDWKDPDYGSRSLACFLPDRLHGPVAASHNRPQTKEGRQLGLRDVGFYRVRATI